MKLSKSHVMRSIFKSPKGIMICHILFQTFHKQKKCLKPEKVDAKIYSFYEGAQEVSCSILIFQPWCCTVEGAIQIYWRNSVFIATLEFQIKNAILNIFSSAIFDPTSIFLERLDLCVYVSQKYMLSRLYGNENESSYFNSIIAGITHTLKQNDEALLFHCLLYVSFSSMCLLFCCSMPTSLPCHLILCLFTSHTISS